LHWIYNKKSSLLLGVVLVGVAVQIPRRGISRLTSPKRALRVIVRKDTVEAVDAFSHLTSICRVVLGAESDFVVFYSAVRVVFHVSPERKGVILGSECGLFEACCGARGSGWKAVVEAVDSMPLRG
jgi:hypothetical protein